MDNTIASQNSKRLSVLSAVFCLLNGITPTDELAQVMSLAVMGNILKWYADNGQPYFNPATELICDEAVQFAFGRVQQIADLARISAAGISAELSGEA